MPTAICFIEKMRKQHRIILSGNDWESGDWKVSPKKAQSLLGKRIYFHEKQVELSYFGGVITGFRILPASHPDTPGRIVFAFTRDNDGTGFRAGAAGWGTEQKTIF